MRRKMMRSPMPLEQPFEGTETQPLAVTFSDLFEHLGTVDVRYSATAQNLSGRDVMIDGFLSLPHGFTSILSLVDQPGACPDCSPVPVAVIALPGARAPMSEGEEGTVRVVGKLDYGLRIADGVASMLRIESARLLLPGSPA